MQAGIGIGEALAHQHDDSSERLQDVEAETHRLETGVVARRAEEGEQLEDAQRELLGRADQRRFAFELRDDCLAIANVVDVGGRVREDSLEEPAVARDPDPPDLEGEDLAHQLAEEEIMGEVGRLPVARVDGEVLESIVRLPGAGPSEKRQVEQVEQVRPIGSRRGGRRQQVGEGELGELAPPLKIGATRPAREQLTDRLRKTGLRPVEPAVVVAGSHVVAAPARSASQEA